MISVSSAIARFGSSHLHRLLHRLLLPAFTLVFGQQFLAQPDTRRRHFDELIFLDILERLLERYFPRRLEDDVLIAARGPHVGQFFGGRRVDGHVGVAGVFGDDHAFVNRVGRGDEHHAAFLEVV